jgi:hypothetical protein
MQDSEEGEDKSMPVKKVERLLGKLDEAAQELAEEYLDRKDDLNADDREAVEGVITKAKQALEEEKHLVENLPNEQRVECDPYRFWVADHACCTCGIIDDTVVAHHPEHMYPSKGGTATKISDFLVVPMCHDCHREVEQMDETEFWANQQVDPRRVSNRLQAEWNARLTQ